MRGSIWTRRALALVAAGFLSGSVGFAQSSSADESKRKIKSRTAPVYPDLARRMNVQGKVKIEVIIAPDGHVKSSRAVGGHPLLVKACEDSVKDWKFQPGPDETTQMVEFDFHI